MLDEIVKEAERILGQENSDQDGAIKHLEKSIQEKQQAISNLLER
ncbi:hypothetical protein SAMN05660649_04324 [Desulfotomaculum arcticum]|uniref:Uncharacterized protein n=1 Tax=Desulfotruncus arcticus DSM 17038 TaxID=1121424 RepID=A0A1I2Y9A2_9FIRM|nr:hypothetical protein SAMN05660649_04324 [Desulfotomaculum arcticum] [Desulfotruncus arcticus DSM 17038]